MLRLPHPSMSSAFMAEEKNVQIPIEWRYPDYTISRYATNLIVQKTPHEYILSFFEVHPPLILGAESIDKLESVAADCVARIIVAAGKMPDFVAVLQEQLKRAAQAEQENE
jgi:hypothetical protein